MDEGNLRKPSETLCPATSSEKQPGCGFKWQVHDFLSWRLGFSKMLAWTVSHLAKARFHTHRATAGLGSPRAQLPTGRRRAAVAHPHVGLPATAGSLPVKTARQAACGRAGVTISCNVITEGTLGSCSVCQKRVTQGEEVTQGRESRRWGRRGHLRGCASHGCVFSLFLLFAFTVLLCRAWSFLLFEKIPVRIDQPAVQGAETFRKRAGRREGGRQTGHKVRQ